MTATFCSINSRCNGCQIVTSGPYDLINHIVISHDANLQALLCARCIEPFALWPQFVFHLLDFHHEYYQLSSSISSYIQYNPFTGIISYTGP